MRIFNKSKPNNLDQSLLLNETVTESNIIEAIHDKDKYFFLSYEQRNTPSFDTVYNYEFSDWINTAEHELFRIMLTEESSNSFVATIEHLDLIKHDRPCWLPAFTLKNKSDEITVIKSFHDTAEHCVYRSHIKEGALNQATNAINRHMKQYNNKQRAELSKEIVSTSTPKTNTKNIPTSNLNF